MVSDYLPPNAENVKEQFESMMTVLKRTIPKWERSSQGDGSHHGNDDNDHPLKDKDDTNYILCDHSSSSEDSYKDTNKEKPRFIVLGGRTHFGLSKIQNFFENLNSYIIYLWCMIDNHQLILSSMNMLSDGVGSRSGARGTPSAITTTSEGEDNSKLRKSLGATFSARKEKDGGKDLLKSI